MQANRLARRSRRLHVAVSSTAKSSLTILAAVPLGLHWAIRLLFAAPLLALSATLALADVPIYQYRQPTLLYPNARNTSGGTTFYPTWDAACVAAATPPCNGTGQCLTNGHGRFKPGFGPGCEYTFTTPGQAPSPVHYQNWSYPTKWCPTGFIYQTASGRCVKTETYQGTKDCPIDNPVYASDGAKRQSEVDFFYSVGGQILPFERTFFSEALSDFRGNAGWGWALTRWSRSLNARAANSASRIIVAVRDAGRSYALQPDANNIWRPTPSDGLEIRPNAGGWLLSDTEGGTQEQYDAAGVLQQLWTTSGQSFILTYSDAATPFTIAPAIGFLISVSSNNGPTLRLAYDSQGRLASAGVDAFRTTTYDYESARPALLTAVTFADGTSRQYIYDANIAPSQAAVLAGTTVSVSMASEAEHNSWVAGNWMTAYQLGRYNHEPLTGIIDESGDRYSTYEYDLQGRVIATSKGSGVGNHAFSYVDPLLQSVVTSPNGSTSTRTYTTVGSQVRQTSQSHPAGSGCGSSTSAVAYGTNGNAAYVDDFNGHRVCYAHETGRNLEAVRVEGLVGGSSGTQCSSVTGPNVSLPAGSRKVTTEWHPDWRRKTRVAEPRRRTTYVYNGQPDPFAGNALASCAPATATLLDNKPIAVLCKQVEQATSDANGMLGFSASLESTVPNRVRSWTYNSFGQVLTETDPVNNTTSYEYAPASTFTGTDPNAEARNKGDLIKVTNAKGKTIDFALYNRAGQVIESTDANGVVTRNLYDLRQRLQSRTVGGLVTTHEYWPTGLLRKVTQPDGITYVEYFYDAAHRLTDVKDNRGNSIAFTLDSAGNRIQERIRDPGTLLRRQLDREIDALGRVQLITGRD